MTATFEYIITINHIRHISSRYITIEDPDIPFALDTFHHDISMLKNALMAIYIIC